MRPLVPSIRQASPGTPMSVRLARRTDASGGFDACWPYLGAIGKNGYGVIGTDDGRTTLAHRAAWSIANGEPIPPGREVCHTCDYRACVNPLHLVLADKAWNMADMARKGRHFSKTKPELVVRGERHGSAKLTEADVRYIRASSEPSTTLAYRFGVSDSIVRDARRGHTWRHVA